MINSFGDINYLAVILAAIVYYGLGALWYSRMLFGNIWLKVIPMTDKDMKNAGPGMVIMAILSLITAFLLAIILLYSTSLSGDFGLSLLVGILFGVMNYEPIIFEKRPIQMFWINASYNLIGLVLMGLIIGFFK